MTERIGTETLLQWDRQHVLHPMCRPGTNRGIVIASAEGITLRDTEGREYLDASAQLANVNIGHGRREVTDAIAAQMAELQYATTHWGMTHPALARCARRLADLTPPGLDHFFFSCGGADAVGAAFKIARLYWSRRRPERFKIVTLANAFHGVSLGTLAATHAGNGRLQQGYGPLVPGFLTIPAYHCYRCAYGLTHPACGLRCAEALAETIRREGAETVAAFVGEPVQGQGMIVPPPGYWPRVREICAEHGVLFIADEVMTGFGRTGRLFAIEHWGIRPDILVLAKGITSGYVPFGATAISRAIFAELEGRGEVFTHGLTYCGHPLGAAAALAGMEIIVREDLAGNAARIGACALAQLRERFLPLPAVGEVSGLGLMLAVEYVADKATRALPPDVAAVTQGILDRGLAAGLFLRASGNRITLGPPLIVTREEMDRILDRLHPLLAALP